MGYYDTRIATLASSKAYDFLGLDHFLAQTPAQREAIYKLRYDAYCAEGLIHKDPRASFMTDMTTRAGPLSLA